MKSVMKSWDQVPGINIRRSVFNRSHGIKTTFDADYLIPIYVDEALPGDTFNCKLNFFGRLATPLHPLMDNCWIETFFFAVPNRLIWTNWEKFCGAQDDPGDSIDFTIPYLDDTVGPLSVAGFDELSLEDYLGIPTKVTDIENICSFWHRAYSKIWNEWFRDENLQDSVQVDTDNGPDDSTDYALLQRGKRHDYFTSCLPWAQKGTAVDLPLGTTAPVVGDGSTIWVHDGSDTVDMRMNTYAANGNLDLSNVSANDFLEFGKIADGSDTGLETDLTSATAATVNEVRQALQVQKLLERDARCGTRYVEIIKSHFNVTSPDFRLQRSEYLGGGKSLINVAPVAQTESSDATTPQGTLTGMGTVSGSGHGFFKSFTEHCVILGLACVTADLTYQEGLDRMFSRSTRYDVYWPELANIGEQSVLNKEIYCDGTAADDNVFGYQGRYDEYRYKQSRITGLFRSNCAASLESWHLSQEFGALPTLNTTFIKSTTPVDRAIATAAEPHIIFDGYFNLKCVRPMPTYSIPGLGARF